MTPRANLAPAAAISVEEARRLRREINKFTDILEAVRAIIWRADASTFRTTFASRQTQDILGFPAERWVHEPGLWKQHIHPADVDWVLDFTRKAVQEKRKHSFEYRMIAADGRIVWLRNIVNVMVKNGEPKELVGLSVDITERKVAEEERARLARRLLRAQENERLSIARELHDHIGQNLAMLNLKLQKVKRSSARAPKPESELEGSLKLATKIADDVERLAHALHSSDLEHVGLTTGVRELCDDFAKHGAIRMKLRLAEVPRSLDLDIAHCIYRVLQECLRNTMKHSKASTVKVTLLADSREIRLRVSDNGVGFKSGDVGRSAGLGLISMRERLRLVGGTLFIASAPAGGARVEAVVPCLKSIHSNR